MTLQETIAAAESPKTCPETLLKLYRDLSHVPEWHRSKIRKKIAGNPNICSTLALEITHWHGREFYKNPVLPLLLLESPNLFDRARHSNLYRMLSWEETPQSLLDILSQHHNPLIAHEAQYHVALHGEYTDDSWIEEVKDALVASACESREHKWMRDWHACDALPSWLSKRLNWPPTSRSFKTARIPPHVTEPAPTVNEASEMQQLTDEEIYSLTQHPGQHPERLRLILEINPNQYPYSFWQVQDAASNHPNVPQDLILSGKIHPHISFCDHASLEAQVEHSQGYSMSALTESLLTHRDADNALCQKALLRTVCSGFYSHNAFPISLSFLGRLHSDSPGNLRFYESFLWWDERIVAALHPGIHPEVRTYIAKDSHRWVRAAAKAAQSNPDTWKRFWE